jgi:hypothetical protein
MRLRAAIIREGEALHVQPPASQSRDSLKKA